MRVAKTRETRCYLDRTKLHGCASKLLAADVSDVGSFRMNAERSDLLEATSTADDPEAAVRALIALAHARGGPDNVSVVVGMVEG